MNKNVCYEILKHDEELNEKSCYYFIIRESVEGEEKTCTDIEFMVSRNGLLFHVINDKNSTVVGLRDYMNFPEDLQQSLLNEYKRFIELIRDTHKIDE